MGKEEEEKRIELKNLKRYSISDRKSKVSLSEFCKPYEAGMSFEEFINSLPGILGAKALKDLAQRIVRCVLEGKMTILGMGAHPIKVGLSPLICQALKEGIFKCIAGHGALVVHDVEISIMGRTSEDVDEAIKNGSFGMGYETSSFINEAVSEGFKKGLGFGESVGRKILTEKPPYMELSILANCVRLKIPVTIHVALGTDIFYMHPEADGKAIGETSRRDFLKFCEMVSQLEGGVFINLGSAVIIPEVFLKAFSLVRNLGFKISDFTTAVLDFQRHYRPSVNVLKRPGGYPIEIIGHHEINFPLLLGYVLELLQKRTKL